MRFFCAKQAPVSFFSFFVVVVIVHIHSETLEARSRLPAAQQKHRKNIAKKR